MTVSHIIDIAAALAVVFFAVSAFHKGFLRTVIELAGYVVSAVAAFTLSVPVGNWLYTTFFRAQAQQFITRYLTAYARMPGVNDGFDGVLAQYHISSAKLPANIVQGFTSLTAMKNTTAMTDVLVDPIGQTIGRGIAFLLIFLICLWVCGRIAHAAGMINRIPVIGAVNRLLGFGAGIVQGVLILFVLDAVVTVLLPLSSISGQTAAVHAALNQSFAYQCLEAGNPLKDMLLKR